MTATRDPLPTDECSQLSLENWESTSILQCNNCQTGDCDAQKLSRCSACKAVAYCSKKCQTDEWNGLDQSSFRKKWNINPHKRKCSWYKRAMEHWPQVAAIQQLFPWSASVRTLREMPQIHNRIELTLGLKGESAENGYWREPAAFEEPSEIFTSPMWSEAYICHGSMLLEPVLPSHVETWKLPMHHIPHIQFETPELKSRMPALHDNDLVQDWASYYSWRKLDHDSPVALRMDMVLTVYHLLTKVLGVVATSKAALKSRRTLKIHLVGVEKELNIIPLFSELALLIPNADISITLFGHMCKGLCDTAASKYPGSLATQDTVFHYTAPVSVGGSTVRVKVNKETIVYNPTRPERPDAFIAENAGLFRTWSTAYQFSMVAEIPFAITQCHMTEVFEFKEHMLQWRDNVTRGMNAEHGSPAGWAEDFEMLSRMNPRGAGLNPFMRPGLLDCSTFEPRAYNGFVLRVC
ncbi:hypothetical protein C8R45DRAFT_964703 [Mycena sanguinolenta]|nr:hypothetical protein C8R45DRAFT_964703 [Mycena sanguinolenta]